MFAKDVALQGIVYITKEYGGKADMHKIFKTLYFADREHLSRYGRSITGDTYIAMTYGPVPSKIDDIFKAVRGDSYFSDKADDLKNYFQFVNKFMIRSNSEPNMDYLSNTDKECLDYAIKLCKDKGFSELTELSHDVAWNNTMRDRAISVKDIIRESGETDEYAEYVHYMMKLESAFA